MTLAMELLRLRLDPDMSTEQIAAHRAYFDRKHRRMTLLTQVMNEASASKASAEILYEVMQGLAATLDGDNTAAEAQQVRNTARTLVPMFGSEPEREWSQMRAATPWFRRHRMPTRAPREWVRERTLEIRQIGRELVADAIERADS